MNNWITKNGILYIAFKKHKGADHLKEVICSVKSVKKIHPNMHITLFTDSEEFKNECFDYKKIIKVDSIREKQNYLYDSPYKNTLYLDSDTKIVGPIDDIFELMGRFDIAACIDHARKDPKKSKIWGKYAGIPNSFPEFAGGVILFRKCLAIKEFFDIWVTNYNIWKNVSGKLNDQPSFRVSLWEHYKLKVYTLPPEYNIRTQEKRDKFEIKPKIFHWHDMYRNLKRTPQKF